MNRPAATSAVSVDHIPHVVATMRSYWPVSDATLRQLVTLLTHQRVPKGYLLVAEGKRAGHAYFIERGMTRSYWMVDGEEITTSFSTEGAIVFSMDELYYDQLSQEYVQTIEPAEVYDIELNALRHITSTNLDLANWTREIHQYEYRRLHRSHKERLTLPAAERYREFAAQFPEVCRRARLTDIASYLGITLSTLSRIRKNAR